MYMYIAEDVIKTKTSSRLPVIYEFYGVVKRFYINYGQQRTKHLQKKFKHEEKDNWFMRTMFASNDIAMTTVFVEYYFKSVPHSLLEEEGWLAVTWTVLFQK